MRLPLSPILAVAAAAAALGVGGHWMLHGRGASSAGPWTLASFTRRDVAVEVRLERDPAGRTWLAGTFTPTRPGFHLYGKDLPREGIRGIGRPTLLEIVPSPSLRAAGPLVADKPEGELAVGILGLRFPVYPAGPVTLRQPVTLARRGAGTAEVSVTYMACTEGTCLAPVVDHRFTVTLPAQPEAK
jgi:hypothetical protein